MLEFIVLGNVPGTHFNITFSWVLGVAAVFLMALEVRHHRQYALKVQAAEAIAAEVTTEIVTPVKRKKPSTKKKSPVKRKTSTKKTATKKTVAKRTTKAKKPAAKKKTTTKRKTTTRRPKA